MPRRTYYLAADGSLHQDLSDQQVKAAFTSGEGLLWVDISETTEEDGRYLEEMFGFHHLAVEDCISPLIHPPKIDDFDSYLFIVVHGINHLSESEIVETAELAIFLGANFVVSNHNYPLHSVAAVQSQVESGAGRLMRRGTEFLAYALIDTLVDNVLPTIDRMSDIAGEIEEEVIRSPHQSTLEAILKLKRSTLRIHRVMAPQREVLNRLSRREFAIIGDETQIFFRDIYDHITRIEDLNQGLRDRSDNALATHLSSVANRQNETTRVLSIVATIFLPLTLVAGIYGMNFEYMPELSWKWGYFSVLGLMGVVIVVVLWRFWAGRWFSWGRKRVVRLKLFAVEPEKLIGYIERVTRIPGRHNR